MTTAILPTYIHEGSAIKERWDQWVHEMRTTSAGQCKERLGINNPDGSESFCCLGLGADMIGLRNDAPRREFADGEGRSLMWFGRQAATSLAPPEFIEWLGLVEETSGEWDIVFDFPEDLSAPLNEGLLLRGLCTAAGMNDSGFTFAQIADVAAYFGPFGARRLTGPNMVAP